MEEDTKLFKLMEKEDTLKKKKDKIEEELKKIARQIKEVEHQQKVKNIEDTIVLLSDIGINLKDVIREIKQGKFDHLRKAPVMIPDGPEQKNEVIAGQM
ncbi:hypothetical protein [Paenibacillus sp. SN-8-1]|uniref:hypothetical protein n=1 Tax=Paenibacillus sp. SN-8-1 TaxID=3435409 RepID=UPI003D9A6F96